MSKEKIEKYLKQSFGESAEFVGTGEIGSLDQQGMKDFGYGRPLLIHFKVDGQEKQAVLSTMRGDKYGHQFYWDRAAILMFQHDTTPRMKKHVPPLGLGYFDTDENMVPVQNPKEFFVLSEKIDGYDYFQDLERIRGGGFEQKDVDLAKQFAAWMADLHSTKKDDPDLYLRRTRQLVGDSECIFGLIDSYPYPYEHFSEERFIKLEKKLIEWRWKLRKYTHRLCATHGDFHPWNVLVMEDRDFRILDRSRGEWGEPADDLSSMALNYVLFGIYDEPKLQGDFEKVYNAFFEEYLKLTGDEEMMQVIAPFFVFRGLVIASPEWYPNHPLPVRQGLFRFLENVLEDDVFDYQNINKYME